MFPLSRNCQGFPMWYRVDITSELKRLTILLSSWVTVVVATDTPNMHNFQRTFREKMRKNSQYRQDYPGYPNNNLISVERKCSDVF